MPRGRLWSCANEAEFGRASEFSTAAQTERKQSMNVEPGSLDAGFSTYNFTRRQLLRRVGTGVATLGALSLSAQVLLLAERAARQKRWREILRIERADRQWEAAHREKREKVIEQMRMD